MIEAAQVSPLADWVFVQMKPRAEVIRGAVVGVSDLSSRIPSNEGVVLAVGPGRRRKGGAVVPLDVRVGERVMVSSPGPSAPVAGVCVSERERLWMVAESDIIGALE